SYAKKIAFAETLIGIEALTENTRTEALTHTMQRMGELTADDPVDRAAKARLLAMIRKFNESEQSKQAIGTAILRSGIEPTRLEADLQMLVDVSPANQSGEDMNMEIGTEVNLSQNDTFDECLSR